MCTLWQREHPFVLTPRRALGLVLALAAIPGLALVAGLAMPDLQAAHANGGAPAMRTAQADEGMPTFPPDDLWGAWKFASRCVISPGEALTYTILIYNHGLTDTLAEVSDPLPAQMQYISDSATGGGVYLTDTATVAWSAVQVPAQGSVLLSFAVAATTDVTIPVLVINTATITANNVSLHREAGVMLMPGPEPGHDLFGAHKSVSQRTATFGDVLTYTIYLHNSSVADTIATVTDPIPTPMSYVTGSATGGDYDPGVATLVWSDVNVPAGDDVLLSFAVTVTANVTTPMLVTNTATISTSDRLFSRDAQVRLLPQPDGLDRIRPIVHSLTIDEQDVLTSPTVTLHISATDNIGVRWMFLREWRLATKPRPHWLGGQSSGWVPYQAEYTWTLAFKSGAHFVGVWVADEARNVSPLTRQALDFASLLLPGDNVPRFGMVPYLVHYDAGISATAVLTPTRGDPDLYVWYPHNSGRPDQKSTLSDMATDMVSFTAPYTGTYLFLVYGHTSAAYDFSITPGGGPQWWAVRTAGIQADTTTAGKPDDFSSEPVLTQSGLDPLNVATAPGPPSFMYLPLIVK